MCKGPVLREIYDLRNLFTIGLSAHASSISTSSISQGIGLGLGLGS